MVDAVNGQPTTKKSETQMEIQTKCTPPYRPLNCAAANIRNEWKALGHSDIDPWEPQVPYHVSDAVGKCRIGQTNICLASQLNHLFPY